MNILDEMQDIQQYSASNRLVSLSLFCYDHNQLYGQANSCKQIKMPSIVITQPCTCFLIHGLSLQIDLAQSFSLRGSDDLRLQKVSIIETE